MANSYSLPLALSMRDAALKAYQTALNSLEYKAGSRQVRHQDLDMLWRQVDKWDRIVCSLTGQSPIVRKTLVPSRST